MRSLPPARSAAAPGVGLAVALVLALSACRTARAPAPAPTAGGIDPAALDRAVGPCDDFYRFACGGWLERTEIPPDRSRWSRSFDEIQERNLAQLRAVADDAAAGKLGPEDRYAGKVGAYYAACMDEDALEARGKDALRAEWKRLDAVKDPRSLALAVGRLHREGVWPIFRLASDQDARDATEVIGVVVQGGLSLPDRDYYLKDDPKSAEIRKELEAHVARMLTLAGVSATRAKGEARAIVGLETRLAEAHWTRVEMRDPVRTYNRVELAGLQKAAPAFPWKAYLDELGHRDLTAFSATTPRFLARLNEVVTRVPADTWRAYLRWRLLSSATGARAVPRAFVEEAFRFSAKTFSGAKELTPRWKHCVQMTDDALGEALGAAWVRRHFGGDGKAKAQRLVAEVEGAMGRKLPELAWMDEPTRRLAARKLERITNKIGFPDAWRSYDALEVDRSSFLRTVAAGRAFEVQRDLDKIGEPLDRGEWLMTPPTVNAYYNPSMNEMAFPAGILQPPFYDPAAIEAANYGAIGMVVGHELTHGFDDQGRKFDALGNLRDWWSPAIAQEFDRRAECVANQYGGYDAVEGSSDLKLNGELTLGENIADLGGIGLALDAYRASRAGKAPERAVEGFTPVQAFFVSYAQSWCSKIRPEAARLRAQTDPHSPARWRVNGPLSNLPDFAAAFACPAGAPMVRAERCEVW